MRIAETLNEGLKREYVVTIPAADFAAKIDAKLKDVAQKVRMPGFRPGKVPANLIRKMHGPAITGEALEEAANEGVQHVVADQKLRPAMQPKVELNDYQEGMDIALKVAVEVLPTVEAPNIEGLKLEKLVVEPSDTEIEAALQRFVEQQKSFEPAPKEHAAEKGDVVVIDFRGTVDGEAFEGGTGEGMQVELGSGRLIPGFEEQLEGVKANEQRTLKVKFPDDYNVAYLKGRDAEFDVTVTEVRTPKPVAIDDALATNLGLESLDQLKQILKDQLGAELGQMTRTYMKRKLLDQLAAAHDFEVPPSMVEAEFQQIWQQLEHEASHEADPEAAKAELEKDRDEYRRIAERRVRLGLLLSEIGQANDVQVSQQEMNRLVMQEASRYPQNQRQQVVQYFAQNPMAAAQLRAPLYEDKVVDFLIGKAEVAERTVSREELQAAIESEDEAVGHVHGPGCGHDHHDHAHGHDHDHEHASAKPKAKRAKAKGEETSADTPVTTESSAADEAAGEGKPKAKRAKAKADAAPADETAAEASADEPAGDEAAAKPKTGRSKKTA